MRIAFVSANVERLPDPVVPLGLLYVMAAVPETETTELWDVCFEDEPLRYLGDKLDAFRPDLVAVGIRNIQSADYGGYTGNLEFYRDVVRAIRERSDAAIVLGGGGFSVMPRELMAYLGADYGISGEGETGFAHLVGALGGRGGDLSEIGSLHYFADGELRSAAAPAAFQDLDGLARPERARVDPRYYEGCGIDSIQTKRGCPLRCDYCTYPLIEGRSIRQRDPAAVVDELVAARDAHPAISHFFVVDSVFNLPPAHAKAVCREMIRRRVEVPWTCYANPLGFDRELAELMVESKCAGAEIGSDSGVDAVLTRLKKGFDTRRVLAMHEDCEAAGLPDCHTFILGTRGETLRDVRTTLDFCVRLDPYAAIFMIWTDDYESLDATLAAERRVFRDEITELMRERAGDFPRWIIPSLGVNYDPRLFSILRRRGLAGPLWQHLHRLRPARRPAAAGASGQASSRRPASMQRPARS